MRIRSGWNTEYARKKYDVEVDEDDAVRLLHDQGIPGEALALLTFDELHNLLYCTAEIKSLFTLSRAEPSMKNELAEQARPLREQRQALYGTLKERWEARQE